MERVREWGLLTAAGVVAICAWLLTAGRPATLSETVVRLGWGAAAVAVAAAVLVAGGAVLRSRRQTRSARRETLLEDIRVELAKVVDQGGHTVQASRWSGVTPGRLVIAHARTFQAGEHLDAIAAAVGRASGRHQGPRRWRATASRLRPRVTLTPRPVAPELEEREVVSDRIVTLLKKTIPGARSVHVTDWGEASDPARIVARFEPSPRLSSTAVEAAILRVVTDALPGRWAAHWEREEDRVTFERKPDLPLLVDRPVLLPAPPSPVLRYGVDADGEVQQWDLGGTGPHALVVGPTGGGKTFALRAMAMDAISQGVHVVGADPKRIELRGLIGVPGVGRIAVTPEEIVSLVEEVYDLMESRYQDLEQLRVRREQLRPVLFILDEFYILKMKLNRLWREQGGKGRDHPVLSLIPELLALARSARIHLCIGIQRPDAEFLEGAARDNVRHRVALTQLSAIGAEMMWEDRTAGTDLPAIPGRAMATGPNGPVEVQVWRVPDPDPRLREERTDEEMQILEPVLAAADPTPVLSGPRRRPVSEEAAGDEPANPEKPEKPEKPAPVTDAPAVTDDVEWSKAAAEALVAGDVVRLDGSRIALTDVEVDEADEDYVVLSWTEGSTALPATDLVDRLVA